MLENLMDQVTTFVEGFPPSIQWLGTGLAGAIPFVESYGATAIGIVVGIHPIVACTAAIVGNAISMLILVTLADKSRGLFKKEPGQQSKRYARFERMFNRFGVPLTSLLGQLVLPSQITSALMVGVGAKRSNVIFWQLISITIWGILLALATTGVISFLS